MRGVISKKGRSSIKKGCRHPHSERMIGENNIIDWRIMVDLLRKEKEEHEILLYLYAGMDSVIILDSFWSSTISIRHKSAGWVYPFQRIKIEWSWVWCWPWAKHLLWITAIGKSVNKSEQKQKIDFDGLKKYIADDISKKTLKTNKATYSVNDLWDKRILARQKGI